MPPKSPLTSRTRNPDYVLGWTFDRTGVWRIILQRGAALAGSGLHPDRLGPFAHAQGARWRSSGSGLVGSARYRVYPWRVRQYLRPGLLNLSMQGWVGRW